MDLIKNFKTKKLKQNMNNFVDYKNSETVFPFSSWKLLLLTLKLEFC